jgi:hypothetical protein
MKKIILLFIQISVLFAYDTLLGQSHSLVEGRTTLSVSSGPNEAAANNSATNRKLLQNRIIEEDGSQIQCGRYKGSYDFDLGVGTVTQPTTNLDMYVAKYDKNDVLIWVKFFSSASTTDIKNFTSITKDNAGNLILTGVFRDQIDFDPGPGVFNMSTGQTGASDRSVFVLKLTSAGDFVWAKKFQAQTTSNIFSALNTAVLTNNDLLIYGAFIGSIDVDPDAGTVLLTTPTTTSNDAYIVKLDANGSYLASKKYNIISFENELVQVTTDAQGNAFALWNQTGNSTNPYKTRAYKLNSDLTDAWETQYGPRTNGPVKLMTDSGNGFYFGDDYTIYRLDKTTGLEIWNKNIFGGGAILDNKEDILIGGGVFSAGIDFDPDVNVVVTIPYTSGIVPYLKKFDINGNFIWAKEFGQTTGSNNVSPSRANSDNSVWASGYFTTTIDIDPSATTNLLSTPFATGFSPTFTAKYCDCATPTGLATANTNHRTSVGGNGSLTQIIDVNNKLICAIKPQGTSKMVGRVDVRENVAVPSLGNTRGFEIEPTSQSTTASALITLYYTQAEFDSYNLAFTDKLPANPTDVNVKNIRITKYGGYSASTIIPSNYPAITPVEINPDDADIVWNSTDNRWEVSFYTQGMGAFFIGAKPSIGVSPASASITCTNTNVTLTATGTSTYSWTGPGGFTSSSASVNISTAGVYSLVGVASNGSTMTATINVVANNLNQTATFTQTNPVLTCASPSTSVTALGGTNFSWTGPNSFTSTQNPVSISVAGTYTATGTATNGCVVSGNVVITEDKTAPTVSVSPTNATITCTSPTTTLTASGGIAYAWSGPNSFSSTLAQVTINAGGTYMLTGTGTNGCTATANAVITANNATPVLTFSPATPVLTCSNPSVTITASGGNTYSWSGPNIAFNFTPTLNTSTVGTYTVTSTGSNGCTGTASVVVTQDKVAPTITITPNSPQLNCSFPSVQLTASGGNGTYTWTGPNGYTSSQNPATISNVGVYYAYGTGTNGCTSGNYIQVLSDFSLPALSISPNSVILTCTSPTAVLTASGTGVSYIWTGPSSFTSNVSNPTVSLVGTYVVTATKANGCTATTSRIVTEDKTPPNSTISPATSILTCTQPNTYLSASQPFGIFYNFSWTGPNGFTSASSSISPISTIGTYSVVVTGSNGCTSTLSRTVTEDKTPPTISITPSITELTCTTPTTTLTASGGNTYSWTSGTSFLSATASVSVTVAGNYVVAVTGVNGCTATASRAITVDKTAPTVSITPASVVLTCTNSSATLTASGGGSYSWTGPNSFTSTSASPSVSVAGTYIVTVTGTNGCTATASRIVTENKTVPTVSVTPTSAVLTCTNPSTSITASGASTYAWSGTGGFTSTNATVSISVADTYAVVGTGTNGCTATTSIIVTENITPPIAVISPTSIVLTCTGSTAILTASGGSSYAWTGPGGFTSTVSNPSVSTAGTYIVTVTGTNGCTATASRMVTEDKTSPTISISSLTTELNCVTTSITLTASGGGSTYQWTLSGANMGNTASINATTQGTYIVSSTGTNGCVGTSSIVITRNITQPTIIRSQTFAVVTCASPTATFTASGAATYSWTGPNGFSTTGNSPSITVSNAGTYIVTGTGSNGCTASSNISVNSNKVNPSVSVNAPSTVLNCIGTGRNIFSSGILADSYSWTGPNSFASTASSIFATAPGIYTVTVTNSSNGCTATESQMISEDKTPPNITVSPPSPVLTCTNLSFTATASGAVQYDWTGPNGFVAANSPSITSSQAGTYVVTGMGQNGCTASVNVVVTENKTAPTVSISPTSAVLTCTNPSTSVTASGASSYSWSGSGGFTSTSATVSINTAGTYRVRGTGTNGCTATVNIIITDDKTAPTVSISPTSAILTCTNPSTSITASGASTYAWSGTGGYTSTSATASISAVGTYVVIGTGTNGCTASASVTITEDKTTPTVTATGGGTFCDGAAINLSASGGSTYSWAGPGGFTSTGAVANIGSAAASKSGTYTVVATGTNGCTAMATSTVAVTVVPIPTVQGNVAIAPSTSVTLTATGCTGTLIWSQSNGTPVTMPVSPSTTTLYYARCSNGTCTSPQSSNVQVTVNTNVIFSIKSGNWEDPTTWNTGVVPIVTNLVTISTGHTVSITTNAATASFVIHSTSSVLNFANTTAKLILGQ